MLVILGASAFLLNKQQNSCANSISCIKDLSGLYKENEKEAVFMGEKLPVPQQIAKSKEEERILGERTGANKHIYIDLTKQMLYAYQDGNLVMSFPVSTGKWGRTPTGDFNIWVKLRYTTMAGGNPAIGTYYNLPNVPYVMFFYNDVVDKGRGYSIHGTYWHNNFGHPMSHGCINMKIEDVERLYYWADPPSFGSITYASTQSLGTPITIYGTMPEG